MKIDKVIHSSNDEKFYLDFWPVVSKIWKLKFKIEPILLYFGNSNDVSEEYGTVIKMPLIEGVPEHTACQLSRYWFPATEKNTTFMTSDIDMIPLSTWYFKDQIINIPDTKLINLNCNINNKSYFPCCYNIAKGSVFREILDLPESWEKFITNNFWQSSRMNHTPYGLNKNLPHWSADEEWSSDLINRFDQNRIVRIFREAAPYSRRIDRSFWSYDPKLVKSGKYYDAHCIRPYSMYKEEIDFLCDLLLDEKEI